MPSDAMASSTSVLRLRERARGLAQVVGVLRRERPERVPDPVPELREHRGRHVRRCAPSCTPTPFERISRAVNSIAPSARPKRRRRAGAPRRRRTRASVSAGRPPRAARLAAASIHKRNVLNSRDLAITSESSSTADHAGAPGRGAQEVVDVERARRRTRRCPPAPSSRALGAARPPSSGTCRRRTPARACPRPRVRNCSVVRRSSMSRSARSWWSQYANTIESTEVCVSFRSMTLPRSSGPNEAIVARPAPRARP